MSDTTTAPNATGHVPAPDTSLRMALARIVNPGAFRMGSPDYYGPDYALGWFSAAQRVALKTADEMLAGPLASVVIGTVDADGIITDPDGEEWQLVPALPTSPMIQAARYAANLMDGQLGAIWDAMRGAAPRRGRPVA